jgi:hypothetical protein
VSGPHLSEARLRQGIILLGAIQLATGAALALAPGAFFDQIAAYGTRNDHFLRDISTYYLAAGAALFMALGRPSWRVPVLFVVTAQYALHAINHLFDIGDADPGWLGPFNFFAITALMIVLGYLLAAAARLERQGVGRR